MYGLKSDTTSPHKKTKHQEGMYGIKSEPTPIVVVKKKEKYLTLAESYEIRKV
jgi:hypothetical protein